MNNYQVPPLTPAAIQEAMQDRDLSYEEIGVLIFIWSQPADWQFNIEDIMAIRLINREKLLRYVAKFLLTGYLQLEALPS